MKETRWTAASLVAMPLDEFRGFQIMLRARAFGLLGIPWEKKYVRCFNDPISGDIVVQWE